VQPSVDPDQLPVLRMKYNAAYTAYRSCVDALSKISMTGQPPSQDLLDNEARALRELTDARGNLLAAMRVNC
jgi:hypothetical protein